MEGKPVFTAGVPGERLGQVNHCEIRPCSQVRHGAALVGLWAMVESNLTAALHDNGQGAVCV